MYLKSLDGVRCIAIMAVLVFHVYEPILPGGFLGVDLFFLISGFIITRNIDHQIANSRFSLKDFYLKRIARLLPAASFLIALTLIASLWLVPTEMRSNFAQGGIYAALSVVNIFFNSTISYFDESASSNPFLHYWSLSVEEQFYIFWPMLLLLALKLKRSMLPLFFLALAIVSALVTFFWSQEHESDVFFLMPFRVFQFAAGACCGLYFERLDRNKADVAAGVGLAIFGASLFMVSGNNYDFLTVSLIPTLGSALILLGIQGRFAQPVLANPVFRFVGLRAYSIYLVHWPIIVFASLQGFHGNDPRVFVSLFTASIILGAALNLLVETPFRVTGKDDENGRRLKPVLSLGVVIAAVTIAAHVWASSVEDMDAYDTSQDLALLPPGTPRDNLDDNGNPIEPVFRAERSDRLGRTFNVTCIIDLADGTDQYSEEVCLKPDTQADILAMGSSHTRGTYMALGALLGENRLALVGGGGCDFLLASTEIDRCDRWNEIRREFIDRPQYKYLVLVMFGNKWSPDDTSAWMETIEQLSQLDKEVIIFLPRPRLAPLSQMKTAENLDLGFEFTSEVFPIQGDGLIRLQDAAADYDNITFINTRDALCEAEQRCRGFDDFGNIIFADAHHLTYWGSLVLAEGIRDQVVEAFGAE